MSEIGRQVKVLFNRCLELPLDQQSAFVADSNYPLEVKQKVLALLQHQNSDIDISGELLDAVKNKLTIDDLKAGDVFNEFELVRPIGRGGQGDVWLAKRIDGQFDQQVAVKILKPIFQQREEQRFLAERALLAQLSHPHIAQLITGGQYSDDRHYMVLEWIDGSDIIAYAKNKKLTLKQRVRLFMQVCEAVAYAHQNGIIHRDIKPSNVLVDNNGVAKLLDFGVAKSKDLNLTETQQEQMLTMAYASPEQIKGEKVSTVSDVYSLGLLLYELITFKKAHQVDNSSPAQLIESVTTHLPLPPSECLAQSDDSVLSTKIDQELDYLVLMALRKEPERRYQTVNDLIQDLKNYLDHKPLKAGGDGWWYRAKKFLFRNPIATALFVLLLVAVLILQISLVHFNRQLAVQRDQALQAQQQAETHAQIANSTKDFLITLLNSASPLGSGGQEISLKDVLALGERQVIDSLNNQPELKTALLVTFGSIQHNLGDYKKAYDYYLQARDLALNNSLFEEAILADAQLALNATWMSNNQLSLAHLDSGDKLLPQISDVKVRSRYYIIKSTCLSNMKRKKDGLVWALKALDELQQSGVEDLRLLGRIHNELGVAYANNDDEKSLEHHQKALHFGQLVFGKMHPHTHTRIINNAMANQRLEHYQKADEYLVEAETIAEKLYAKNHPRLGDLAAERAVFLHDRGAFSKALPKYKQALELAAINEGIESSEYAVRLNNISYLYEDLGDYQQAEAGYRESIRIRIKVWGEKSMGVASARSNLSRVLAKRNQWTESKHVTEQVISAYEENGRNNLYNEVTLWAIELQQTPAGQCGVLLNDMQTFLDRLNQESIKSWRRLGAQLWLGRLFYQCGEKQTAESLLKSVLTIVDNIYLADSQGHQMVTKQAHEMLNNLNQQLNVTATP